MVEVELNSLKVSIVNLLHFFHATKKTKTLFISSSRKLNSKKLCQSVASSVNWARRDSCWEASFLEELSKYKRDCMAKQRITFCRIFWTHTDIHFDGVLCEVHVFLMSWTWKRKFRCQVPCKRSNIIVVIEPV